MRAERADESRARRLFVRQGILPTVGVPVRRRGCMEPSLPLSHLLRYLQLRPSIVLLLQ